MGPHMKRISLRGQILLIATVFLALSACSTTVNNVVPKTDVKSGTNIVSTGDTASQTSESSQNSISQPSQSLGSQQSSEVNGKLRINFIDVGQADSILILVYI